MPADKAIVRYRQYLDDWQGRGWRIDVAAIERNRKLVAYAIPSPARRKTPKGWVLESVPLLPAKGESAAAMPDTGTG